MAAVGLVLVSGGSEADPRTPPALPGLPPPFLGTAVAGDGGMTAAIDAYGNVVDLRAPGPAGRAVIENPADRQAAGSVDADTGIVPRVAIGEGPALPLWRADSVSQRYLRGTNVVRTVARFLFDLGGGKGTASMVSVTVTDAVARGTLARVVKAEGSAEVRVVPSLSVNVEAGAKCEAEQRLGRAALICRAPGSSVMSAAETIRLASFGDRVWLRRARALGAGAPDWAREMYERSLLTLHALTDRRTGAVAAGARDGWAYVWPRDAGAVALAFAAAGYRPEARRVARFLGSLDLGAAARFHGDGTPVEGRVAQGDAAGWAAVASLAAKRGASWTQEVQKEPRVGRTGTIAMVGIEWSDRADYREGERGTFLANAITSGLPAAEIADRFGSSRGLDRAEGADADLDSAAAWAVRPFAQPALFPAARRTLLPLASHGTRFGITPGEGWHGGPDPWSAPTAWSAWSLAALDERGAALPLLADLRRAATPAGALPERVGAQTGIPTSTTPLAWSHAFAILALRELWPSD
ncbi:MAG TPA: glycoside hydrolase family 15 protein [Solirubrobacterales bacterium]|nr:glycoside hydrolase family 15 protein [Solirubrobacterales bacterium]